LPADLVDKDIVFINTSIEESEYRVEIKKSESSLESREDATGIDGVRSCECFRDSDYD